MRIINKTLYDWCIENNKQCILEEWDYDLNYPLTPKDVPYSTNRYFMWRCKKGHSYKCSGTNKVKLSKCPYCSNKKLLVGYNDLLSQYPSVCKEWDYSKNSIEPDSIVYGSDKKVWWICSNNHSWQALVRNRTIYHNNCPICARKRVNVERDISTEYPSIYELWDFEGNIDIDPLHYNLTINHKISFRCINNHSFKASIKMLLEGYKCPKCNKIIGGVNDFATLNPLLVKEWDFELNAIDPYTEYPLSHDVIYWKCSKNHSWSTTLYQRLRGTKCPICLNKKVLAGYNDLESQRKDIALEWDYVLNNGLKPSEVVVGSRKVVYFKCINGHSYSTTIINRTKRNYKCPICKK